jgi:O-antigen ligase
MIRHRGASAWIVSAGLVGLAAWAPLPFGSVEPAAAAWVRLGALVTAALALVLLPGERLRTMAVPASAAAGIAVIGLLQSLRWPAGLVGVLSSEHLELAAASPAVADASPGRVALSLAPDLSRVSALGWLAGAALLVAAAAVGRLRWPRRAVAGALVLTAGFEVVYGFRQLALRSTEIWGRQAQSGGSRLRGTYVNANHLASYLEMALAVMLAVSWWSWRRARAAPTVERRLLLVGAPALVWLGLLVALAFSGSRGGLVACAGGTLVQVLLIARMAGSYRIAVAGLGVLVAGLAAIAFVGLEAGLQRFLQAGMGGGLMARLDAMAATFELWQRFPWLGSGLGSFREAFPLVQPADLYGSWWHAHNDFLELLATTGVVGFAVFASGLVALVRRLWQVLRRGERSEDRAAALAALGAIATVGAHELVDFGMTLPGNWVAMTVLCGMAAAAPRGRRQRAALAPGAGLATIEPEEASEWPHGERAASAASSSPREWERPSEGSSRAWRRRVERIPERAEERRARDP